MTLDDFSLTDSLIQKIEEYDLDKNKKNRLVSPDFKSTEFSKNAPICWDLLHL